MVLQGQDKWRRHPLIYQCYKNPFPGLKIAVGIFSVYLLADGMIRIATAPPASRSKPNVRYSMQGVEGDAMPSVKATKHH